MDRNHSFKVLATIDGDLSEQDITATINQDGQSIVINNIEKASDGSQTSAIIFISRQNLQLLHPGTATLQVEWGDGKSDSQELTVE